MTYRVNVIGTGYVGLVTGLCVAQKSRHQIHFIERDINKLNVLKSGQMPFFEPGLEALFKANRKRISFWGALSDEDFATPTINLICVGTPQSESGTADLSAVHSVATELRQRTQNGAKSHIVLVKSTVPPGTVEHLQRAFFAGSKITAGMNPEFLREGCAVTDGLNQDRIVLGVHDETAWRAGRWLYRGFRSPLIRCSPTEAEMGKYTNNSLLALLISFSNEMATLAQQTEDVDIRQVIDIVMHDRRWLASAKNKNPAVASYFWPGCGFGGSCFPKDVSALTAFARSRYLELPCLEGILKTNRSVKIAFAELAAKQIPNNGPICLLGLAFKPETDDIRESPALAVIDHLLQLKRQVVVHDPVAELPAPLAAAGVKLYRKVNEALKDAAGAALITSWPEYRKLTEARLLKQLKNPIFIDGRGFLADRQFKKLNYTRIGRK